MAVVSANENPAKPDARPLLSGRYWCITAEDVLAAEEPFAAAVEVGTDEDEGVVEPPMRLEMLAAVAACTCCEMSPCGAESCQLLICGLGASAFGGS